ncbi:MAG TPA: protein kinase [Fimbriiglobus sp.]
MKITTGTVPELAASPTGVPAESTVRSDGSLPHVVPEARPHVSAEAVPQELSSSGEYAEIREIGRGGMGVVYLAKNTLMGRFEVLKVVNRARLAGTRTGDRFVREIRVAAGLKHPNVVTAYSARRLGDLLVFAMEYVPGTDLAQLVRQRGPLPIAEACEYAYQTALGLQHAHDKGMIHRDIKPSNLILSRDGNQSIVKILDFGLAKGVGETAGDEALTGQGVMLGTPGYVAPEQIRDGATADGRSDVYSLGCTLYYLLAGRPPFAGKTVYATLSAHQTADPPKLSVVRPDVPDGLVRIVSTMMAKDPVVRYPTPGEAAAALEPFVRPGPAPVLPTPRPRRWLHVAVGILVLGLGLTWAGGVFHSTPKPPTTPSPPTTNHFIGTWKMVRTTGDFPAGNVMELDVENDHFAVHIRTADGARTFLFRAKYAFDADRSHLTYEAVTPGVEKKEVMTVTRLTADELHWVDSKGTVEEFKRIH